jgi:predicted NAD/FAD-binding protein
MTWTKQVEAKFTPEAWAAWQNNSAVVQLIQERSVTAQIHEQSSLAVIDHVALTYTRQWLDQDSVDQWVTFTESVREQFSLPAVTYTITDI